MDVPAGEWKLYVLCLKSSISIYKLILLQFIAVVLITSISANENFACNTNKSISYFAFHSAWLDIFRIQYWIQLIWSWNGCNQKHKMLGLLIKLVGRILIIMLRANCFNCIIYHLESLCLYYHLLHDWYICPAQKAYGCGKMWSDPIWFFDEKHAIFLQHWKIINLTNWKFLVFGGIYWALKIQDLSYFRLKCIHFRWLRVVTGFLIISNMAEIFRGMG